MGQRGRGGDQAQWHAGTAWGGEQAEVGAPWLCIRNHVMEEENMLWKKKPCNGRRNHVMEEETMKKTMLWKKACDVRRSYVM